MPRNTFPAPTDGELARMGEKMSRDMAVNFRVDEDGNVYAVNPDGTEIPIPEGVGIPGAQGEPGYTPIKGVDYFDGEKGEKGDVGPAGSEGPQGSQGVRGEKGETGATGPSGPQGNKGDTGEQGQQGLQGPQGERGAAGPTGPSPYVYAKTHTTGTDGMVTVTFPEGVLTQAPIVAATVVADSASSYSYRVEMMQDPTSAQAIFRTTRTRNTQFSLLGLSAIRLTEPAPSIKIHVIATNTSG